MPSGKSVRVLELYCGKMQLAPLLLERHPEVRVHYHAVGTHETDAMQGPEAVAEGHVNMRLKRHYQKLRLDLKDPAKLKAQLQMLFGDLHFDEIHLHSPSLHGEPPAIAAECLKVVAERLRPGAPLFQSFQVCSPILSLRSKNSRGDKPAKLFERNLERIGKDASSAGLEVETYGFRGGKSGWIFSSQGQRKALKHREFEEELERYTNHAPDINHFLVLRKPI